MLRSHLLIMYVVLSIGAIAFFFSSPQLSLMSIPQEVELAHAGYSKIPCLDFACHLNVSHSACSYGFGVAVRATT